MPPRPPRPAAIRIGISGWTYPPWRNTFYPQKLPHKNELPYAAAMLPTIEINGTFYSLQRPQYFAKWYDQTPPGFVFSVKAPRYITHMLKLRNVQSPVANFLLSGVLRLNEKLGPLLWQFPPIMQYHAELWEPFLARLPHTTKDAAKLLKHCDSHVKGRTSPAIDRDRPLRHAVEIRHESFATESFIRLLRKHNIALVIADTAGKWPMLHDVTADFIYLRLHGAEELYAGGYTDPALDDWADKIRFLSKGNDIPTAPRIGPPAAKRAKRDVFVYFDNDVKVAAPFDAARLALKLHLRNHPLEHNPPPCKETPPPQWPPFSGRPCPS